MPKYIFMNGDITNNMNVINGKFFSQKTTGVQRFARELLVRLDSIVEKEKYEIVIPHNALEIPHYKNIKVVIYGKLSGNIWEQIELPLYVIKKNAQLINLCNSAPVLVSGIISIHDMKIKAMPQYFSKKFLLWYRFMFYINIKKSKKIITVSNFSKKEIQKYYNVNADKINIIFNGWEHYQKIEIDENILLSKNIKKYSYYFSLSSMDPNKNFKWILEVARRCQDDFFVIAGAVNKKIFANELLNNNLSNVIYLGYVSDVEAKTFMKYAKAFIYPTFYEGFGIPPLEAMSVETKSIVSNNMCMKEIYGKSVIYINPYKTDYDIDEIIKNDNNKLDFSLLEKYNWNKSATKLKKIIEG